MRLLITVPAEIYPPRPTLDPNTIFSLFDPNRMIERQSRHTLATLYRKSELFPGDFVSGFAPGRVFRSHEPDM